MLTERPGVDAPARRRALVFLLTSFGAFLVSLDVSVANSLLPSIGHGLHDRSQAALSWVITAYAIVFAAALVPAGRLADRGGRRRVFLGGLGTFAAGSLVCGLAPDLPVLVLGRVIQGAGAAAASPASLGLLLHVVPSERRAVATARWAGMGALGIGLGPLVGGVFTEALSWRWAFLVNVPLVILTWALGPSVLTETGRVPGRRLPDPVGALVFAVAAAAITFALSEVSDWGIGDPRVLAALVGGLGLGVVFVRRCLAATDPLLDLTLLRSRHVAAVTVVTVLYSCGFFGLLFSFVQFLSGPWHLSLIRVGAAMLPMAGCVVALTTRVGHLANRTGFRLPLVVGAWCMALGLGLQAWHDHGSHFSPWWLAFAAVVGVGIGLCYPLLGAAAVAGLDPRDLAAVTAVNQCARQIGAALGVAATVAVLGTAAGATPVGHFHAAWELSAGFCLAAGVAALFLGRRRSFTTPTT